MDLGQRIHCYLKATAMPPTKFGRLAVNDPRLIGDMKNGRQIGASLSRRIDACSVTRGSGVVDKTGWSTRDVR